MIPIEDRQVLLTVHLEERSWVRLKDGTIGYVVAFDHTSSQSNLWVAAPPQFRSAEKTIGTPLRRLYTSEDMKSFMAKSRSNRFFSRYPATHTIISKSGVEYLFCGPLQLKSISIRSCTPVPVPNPFELLLFIEANAAWPRLLASFRDHGFDTSNVGEFDTLKFLFASAVQNMGRRYAAEFLKSGDRVRLPTSPTTDPGMIGVVTSLYKDNVKVFFPTIQHRELYPRSDIYQVFEALDLVEVHCGRHERLRGMIMMIEDDVAYVQDETDVNSIVSFFIFFCYLLLK